MAESPFEFKDPLKPRLVTNLTMDWNKIYGSSALLWGLSSAMYMKHVFRVNNNPVYLMTFLAGSVPASYGYAKFLMSSPE